MFEYFNDKKIGIMGVGKLGLVIAKLLLDKQLIDEKQLLISHGHSSKTREKIEQANLHKNIVDAKKLAAKSDVIFLVIRPQDAHILKQFSFNQNAEILSMMAATSVSTITTMTGIHNVLRVMVCGPDAIRQGHGIAGIVPSMNNSYCHDLFRILGCKTLFVKEAYAHYFCTFTSLHALVLLSDINSVNTALSELQHEIPLKELNLQHDIMPWLKSTALPLLTHDEIERYLQAMSTGGGITAAMLNNYKNTLSCTEALHAGIRRSQAIAKEIHNQ